MKYLVSALLVFGIATPAVAQTPAASPPVRQQLPADSLAIARKYVTWLWTNQIDSLFAHMPPEDATPEARQQFTDQLTQINARAGVEQSVVEEKWTRRNGNRQYFRAARFSDFTDEPLVLRFVILPDGRIGGMGFGPLSRVPPMDPEP